MNTDRLQYYKQMLDEVESTLNEELDHTRSASSPLLVDGSMGRVSRSDAMQTQQLALEMKRRREERLLRIHSARLRMQAGTYGLCGRCRRPIDDARLDAFPDVVLCVQCASKGNRN